MLVVDKWQFPEERTAILQGRKKQGLSYAGGVGTSGLIALLVGLKTPGLSWDLLSVGEKLGIIIYAGSLIGGIGFWAVAVWQLARLRTRVAR